MAEKLFFLHDPDLKPQVMHVPGMPDDGMVLNIDACILLAKDGETEKARQAYRLYSKHRRRLHRQGGHGLSGTDLRAEAFFRALEEMGVSIKKTRLANV